MSTTWGFPLGIIAIFVSFLSMVMVAMQMTSWAFYLSVVLYLVLLLYTFGCIGIIARGGVWGWTLLLPVTLVLLMYSLLVYWSQGLIRYEGLLIGSSVALFAITVLNMRHDDSEDAEDVPKVEVYTPDKVEPAKKSSRAAAKRKKTSKKKKSAKKKRR